jgi:hypothetical protein
VPVLLLLAACVSSPPEPEGIESLPSPIGGGSTSMATSANTPTVLAAGTSNGVAWTLVPVGNGLELRWVDEQTGRTARGVDGRQRLEVGWHTFGRFDPDDAVVFGIVPPATKEITHRPGQGLPATRVELIDVPAVRWQAFVLTTYSAIGVVAAREDERVWRRLIVPPGARPIVDFVGAFLQARTHRTGGEAFLSPAAERAFGRSNIAPLYAGWDGSRYVRWEILFLDSSGAPERGGWEVGVRMRTMNGGLSEDTLFVRARPQGDTVIVGLRAGVAGP